MLANYYDAAESDLTVREAAPAPAVAVAHAETPAAAPKQVLPLAFILIALAMGAFVARVDSPGAARRAMEDDACLIGLRCCGCFLLAAAGRLPGDRRDSPWRLVAGAASAALRLGCLAVLVAMLAGLRDHRDDSGARNRGGRAARRLALDRARPVRVDALASGRSCARDGVSGSDRRDWLWPGRAAGRGTFGSAPARRFPHETRPRSDGYRRRANRRAEPFLGRRRPADSFAERRQPDTRLRRRRDSGAGRTTRPASIRQRLRRRRSRGLR